MKHHLYLVFLALCMGIIPNVLALSHISMDPITVSEPTQQQHQTQQTDKKQSSIILTSGSKLPVADFTLRDAKLLQVHSPMTLEPLITNIDRVQEISIENAREATGTPQASIQLLNGDTIMGSITQLTPTQLSLHTEWSGELQLYRSEVKTISYLSNIARFDLLTLPTMAWTAQSSPVPVRSDAGLEIKNGQYGLSQHLPNQDSVHIRINIASKYWNYYIFMSLWEKLEKESKKLKHFPNRTASSGVNLYLSSYQLQLIYAQGSEFANHRIPYEKSSIDGELKTIQFDIFLDKKSGTCYIYQNNKFAGKSTTPWPERSTKDGDFMSLVLQAEDSYAEFTLVGFTIEPWDSTDPAPYFAQLEALKSTNTDKSIITLNNGDILLGDVSIAHADAIVVTNPRYKIPIPTTSVRSITPPIPTIPTVVAPSPTTMAFYLSDQTSISINTDSIDATKIKGKLPNGNPIEIDKSMIRVYKFIKPKPQPTTESKQHSTSHTIIID